MPLKLDRDFFLRLLNSMDAPVFVKDRDHRWLVLNDRMCQMFGLPREQLLGKSDYDFFPKEQADVFWEKDEAVFASGLTNENEEYFTDQHGVRHTIITRKSAFVLASGEPVLVGFIFDVTKQREDEKALNEAKDRSELAIEGADLGLWDWRIQEERVFHNSRWKGMLGYSADELDDLPATFYALLHPDDRERVASHAQRYIAGLLLTYSVEFRLKRKDGAYHWVLARGRVIERAADGTPLRMVGTHLDIDERKRHEEKLQLKIEELNATRTTLEQQTVELERARQVAENASRAKSEFLAHMSHEIRTPMSGVMGMADLLKESSLSEEQREMVGSIIFSGRILLSVINDILDFSKIEAQKIELVREVFDLHTLLLSLEKAFSHASEEAGVTLSVVFEPGLPRFVVGDSARLQQVLTNMLANALKFTPAKGCVLLNVHGHAEAHRQWMLSFDVFDSGIGIEDSAKDRILNAFEQADSRLSRRYGGTGLGLAISSRLIKMMGGDLAVHSKLGAGSTFSFCIPFMEGKSEDVQSSSHGALAATLPALRILIAEDNLVNQKVISKILTRAGHSVLIVENGARALEEARRNVFDLILMDIQMPVMDGEMATKMIRSDESIAPLPIIALTAHALMSERNSYLEAGMNGYVVKPIDQRQLFGEIARVLDGRCETQLGKKPH